MNKINHSNRKPLRVFSDTLRIVTARSCHTTPTHETSVKKSSPTCIPFCQTRLKPHGRQSPDVTALKRRAGQVRNLASIGHSCSDLCLPWRCAWGSVSTTIPWPGNSWPSFSALFYLSWVRFYVVAFCVLFVVVCLFVCCCLVCLVGWLVFVCLFVCLFFVRFCCYCLFVLSFVVVVVVLVWVFFFFFCFVLFLFCFFLFSCFVLL